MQRYVVLKVIDLVLVHIVVHFLIHSFDYVVLWALVLLKVLLHHGYLDILDHVPGHDHKDILFVIIRHDLKHMVELCGPNLCDFNIFVKINIEIYEVVF